MTNAFLRLLKDPVQFYRSAVLRRVYNNSPVLKRLRNPSQIQRTFIQKLSRYKINWDPTKKNVILAQSVSDLEACIKIAAVSHKLAKQQNANIGFYSAEYFEKAGNSFGKYLSSTKFKSNLDKLYYSFADKALYRNNDLHNDQNEVNSVVQKIIQGLKTKMDVINIHIENIKIGDLVYDTYLRYANKPEVDLKDPYLRTLVERSVNIFFVTKNNIKLHNVTALVTSYATYIYHGIAVRLCLANTIPVYSIGAYYSLVHKVLPSYPSHANDHFLFHKQFKQLPDQEEILRTHKPLFEKRFEGVIDSATSYMKQSAFSNEVNKELNGIEWNKTVVILAHCFFDSPHIYRDLLFPDFYEWMLFTLNELVKQKDITVIVKQHPNGLPGNDEIYERLKTIPEYSKVKFINKNTSQLQIINSKPKAIITAYGTAAAEFTYQGFPVVTIYDNPFAAYDFTHNANSIEEYKELLSKVTTLPAKQQQMEIIEYYYMQYFFFLKGYPSDYLNCAKHKGETSSEFFLEDHVPTMDTVYFEKLDAITQKGFDSIAWEEKIGGS